MKEVILYLLFFLGGITILFLLFEGIVWYGEIYLGIKAIYTRLVVMGIGIITLGYIKYKEFKNDN